MAKELEGVIRVGAVNCEDDWALCRTQGIHSYPSLVLYPRVSLLTYPSLVLYPRVSLLNTTPHITPYLQKWQVFTEKVTSASSVGASCTEI